jgi:hypothetical protein
MEDLSLRWRGAEPAISEGSPSICHRRIFSGSSLLHCCIAIAGAHQERWFPQGQLDSESPAFDVLFGGQAEQSFPAVIGAEAWFDRDEAARYELREQTIRVSSNEILTLLLITDGRMLEDR